MICGYTLLVQKLSQTFVPSTHHVHKLFLLELQNSFIMGCALINEQVSKYNGNAWIK